MLWRGMIGRVIGEEDAARSLVDGIEAQLAIIATNHPEWTGKTATLSYVNETDMGVYTSNDVRSRLLAQLGFVVPQVIDDLAEEDGFYIHIGFELVEADLTIWMSYSDNDRIANLAGHPFLQAVKDGRNVYIGPELAGAFSHASLLSLPFVIDRMAPMIEAALDGDPQTHADAR